jgi:hypothetical protein
MKSIVKKVSVALLVVPMLVLGIGVFGAVPAYASGLCPKNGSNWDTSGTCYTQNSDGDKKY